MADVYWIGGAAAVVQVEDGSIDSVDGTPANNTFTLTVGDAVVSQVGDTDVATTAAALVVLAEASVHPHMSAITWTNPSAGNITGTADVAGVPFVAVLTETGAGTGAVTDFTTTTASAGPTDWSTAANWSGGAVPVSADTVLVDKSDTSLLFGLDQNAVAVTTVDLRNNLKVGLPWDKFTTSADGTTTNASYREYRQTYLKIDYDRTDIGLYFGSGTNTPPTRVKLEQVSTAASVTRVHTTGSAADTGLPVVRIKAADADADLFVLGGTVGVSVEPGGTTTIGEVVVESTTSATRLNVGVGATLTSYRQRGGTGLLAPTAVTTVDCDGGTLTVEGDYAITTMNVRGGVCVDNHINSGGNAVTSGFLYGGTLNHQNSREPRTYGTTYMYGGTLSSHDAVTFTSFKSPNASGDWQVTSETL